MANEEDLASNIETIIEEHKLIGIDLSKESLMNSLRGQQAVMQLKNRNRKDLRNE